MKYYVAKYTHDKVYAVCCEVCKNAIANNFPRINFDELAQTQQIGLQAECDYCNNNE